MDNLPRFLFYASSVIVASAAIILFSTDVLAALNDPSWLGSAVLLGFGLIYMNIVFLASRRYMRRLSGPSFIPYVIGTFVFLPPTIWVNIYDTQIGNSKWLFIATLLIGCVLGAYFGHRAGLKAQIVFQKKMQDYLNKIEKIPDNLKRPHDHLNKN